MKWFSSAHSPVSRGKRYPLLWVATHTIYHFESSFHLEISLGKVQALAEQVAALDNKVLVAAKWRLTLAAIALPLLPVFSCPFSWKGWGQAAWATWATLGADISLSLHSWMCRCPVAGVRAWCWVGDFSRVEKAGQAHCTASLHISNFFPFLTLFVGEDICTGAWEEEGADRYHQPAPPKVSHSLTVRAGEQIKAISCAPAPQHCDGKTDKNTGQECHCNREFTVSVDRMSWGFWDGKWESREKKYESATQRTSVVSFGTRCVKMDLHLKMSRVWLKDHHSQKEGL